MKLSAEIEVDGNLPIPATYPTPHPNLPSWSAAHALVNLMASQEQVEYRPNTQYLSLYLVA